MNAILLFDARRQARPVDDDKLAVFPAGAANDTGAADGEAVGVGIMGGAESLLTVSFVGISAFEQERALASFPGGRRCILAEA